jgi:hypothetical protein
MNLGQCQTCLQENVVLYRHHIIPRSRGGTDSDNNLINLCETCHGKIHNVDFTDNKLLIRMGLKAARDRGVVLGAPKGSQHRKGKRKTYDPNLVEKILKLRKKGHTYRDIADVTSVSHTTIATILRRVQRNETRKSSR